MVTPGEKHARGPLRAPAVHGTVACMQHTATENAPGTPLIELIRSRIISGELAPGELIPETALAEEFNVSRTPVREAFKVLQMEGLVHIRPRVGTFVHEPSRREIVEMFQIKESLEGLAASLMARRGSIPELDALQRNVDESDAAAAHGDSARYAELVAEFHWTLIRGADNSKLSETYTWLMNQLAYQRLVERTVADPKRLTESDREHHKVLEAIRQKDPYGAEMAMRDHVHASSRAALYRTFGNTEAAEDTEDTADTADTAETEEQQ
jgi:DNA-binding GntR family transcriptional regulator